MKPVLFSFGAIHLYSYGLSIALGVLLSVFLMKRRAAKEGFPGTDEVFDMAFAVLVWGFAGARIFYIIQNFSYYAAEPLKVFAVWEGGLIFYGGALSAFLGLWLTARLRRGSLSKVLESGAARKKKLPFWKLLDFLAPYGALTHAFGRVGCFLNGCCFGKESVYGIYSSLHEAVLIPTQIYSSFALLLIFVILRFLQGRPHREGQVFYAYLFLI